MIKSHAMYTGPDKAAVTWIDEAGNGVSGAATCADVAAYLGGGGKIFEFIGGVALPDHHTLAVLVRAGILTMAQIEQTAPQAAAAVSAAVKAQAGRD